MACKKWQSTKLPTVVHVCLIIIILFCLFVFVCLLLFALVFVCLFVFSLCLEGISKYLRGEQDLCQLGLLPERIYNPFSWKTLRGKHCRHPIAVMVVVDTLGP